MKKFVSFLVVSSTLFLPACEGISDSSGSAKNEPFEFVRYNSCSVSDNIVTVPFLGCKTSHPSLNKGQTFALECTIAGFTNTGQKQYKLEVRGAKSADIQSVVNDIEKQGKGSIYQYYCFEGI